MSIYGIDVCSYQGSIDWAKVKKAGCGFAVLKCIMKGLGPDTAFSRNVRGCAAQNIPVGVYTYVYENSVSGAVKRSQAAVAACKAQGLKGCTIWWDVEDKSIRKPAKKAQLTESILAAKKVVEAAGYGFGVYCDIDFYKSCLSPKDIGGKWWIASYGGNYPTQFGFAPGRLKPGITTELCGWQYCSRGKVPGISGNVDLDIAYDDDFTTIVGKTTVDGIPVVQRTVANKYGANLRELPSGESKVSTEVRKGTVLDVAEDWTATNTVGTATDYVCVHYGGKWLWCAKKLLG